MCAPVKVDSTLAIGKPTLNKGDATALGKLVVDMKAVPTHSTCVGNVKGSTMEADEDCRFLWFPLAIATNGTPASPVNTPYNNTLGFCYPYGRFKSITVPGNPAKQPEKSCAALPVTTTDPMDPYGTAEQNGCYPLANSPRPPASSILRRNPYRTSSYRFANGNGVAVRHILD
jgi:hypothetical protein